MTVRRTPAFWILQLVPIAMLFFAFNGLYAVVMRWNNASQDLATRIWMVITLVFSIFIGYIAIELLKNKPKWLEK